MGLVPDVENMATRADRILQNSLKINRERQLDVGSTSGYQPAVGEVTVGTDPVSADVGSTGVRTDPVSTDVGSTGSYQPAVGEVIADQNVGLF